MLSRLRLTLSRFLSIRSFGQIRKPKTLPETLTSTFEYESAMYTKNDSIGIFLRDNDLELIESDLNSMIYLNKTVSGYQVKVSFDANSFQVEEPNEEKKEGDSFLDFEVLVKRGDAGLHFVCASQNGNIYISTIRYTAKDEPTSKDKYQGPDFSILDERLRKTWLYFLQKLGVTEELVSVMSACAVDKDQRLYMQWLLDTKEVIKR